MIGNLPYLQSFAEPAMPRNIARATNPHSDSDGMAGEIAGSE